MTTYHYCQRCADEYSYPVDCPVQSVLCSLCSRSEGTVYKGEWVSGKMKSLAPVELERAHPTDIRSKVQKRMRELDAL